MTNQDRPAGLKSHFRRAKRIAVGLSLVAAWLPLSWIIQHWIGIFHSVARTVLIIAAWYILPEQRFVAIPIGIVAVYLVTVAVLEKHWRSLQPAS